MSKVLFLKILYRMFGAAHPLEKQRTVSKSKSMFAMRIQVKAKSSLKGLESERSQVGLSPPKTLQISFLVLSLETLGYICNAVLFNFKSPSLIVNRIKTS